MIYSTVSTDKELQYWKIWVEIQNRDLQGGTWSLQGVFI